MRKGRSTSERECTGSSGRVCSLSTAVRMSASSVCLLLRVPDELRERGESVRCGVSGACCSLRGVRVWGGLASVDSGGLGRRVCVLL